MGSLLPQTVDVVACWELLCLFQHPFNWLNHYGQPYHTLNSTLKKALFSTQNNWVKIPFLNIVISADDQSQN